MKTLLGLIISAGVLSPAMAAFHPAPPLSGAAPVIRVEGGCGRDFHRDWEGRCRPNYREWEDRRPMRMVCPPGYHFGPDGRRCWPN